MRKMLGVLLLAVMALMAVAQEAAKPSTDPKAPAAMGAPEKPVPQLTELQKLKVMAAYQRATIAIAEYSRLQREYQEALDTQTKAAQAYFATCKEILKEAGVGPEYACNVDYPNNNVTLVKVPPPAPPAAPPAAAKQEAPKQ